jgi:hypothetical protein
MTDTKADFWNLLLPAVFITLFAFPITSKLFYGSNSLLVKAVSLTKTLKVQTTGIKGVQIKGVPTCSGTTDVNTGYYECSGLGNITTILYAPDRISTDKGIWDFTGWEGCDITLNNSITSNKCAKTLITEGNSTVTANYTQTSSPQNTNIGESGNVIVTPGYMPAIAMGVDGKPIIAYYTGTKNNAGQWGQWGDCDDPTLPGECDLVVVKCGDANCSRDNITTTVDETGDVGLHVSLSIDNDGLPILSYFEGWSKAVQRGDYSYRYCSYPPEYPETDHCNLKVLKCADAACGSGNTITRVDVTGATGFYSSITAVRNSAPVISYWGRLREFNILKCGNSECSQNNVTTIAETLPPLHDIRDTDISVGNDNLPIISYVTMSSPNAVVVTTNYKTLKCGNINCNQNNIKKTLFSELGFGWLLQRLSIDVDSNNLPVAALYPLDGRKPIKVIKCAFSDCSLFTTAEIDHSQDNDELFSLDLSLDSNNLPIFTYDSINTITRAIKPKFLKCSDPTCTLNSLNNNRSDLASSGSMPVFTLDSANIPSVAYWNKESNWVLKFMKCTNQVCSSSAGATTP